MRTVLAYAVRRLVGAVPTIFLVVTLVFLAMRLLPGDPAVAVLGENASPAQINDLREKLGLNEPLWMQYFAFLGRLAHFDLGVSLSNSVPITQLIGANLPYTIELALAATVLGTLIGVPIGVLSAVRAGRVFDHVGRVLALTGLSMPEFFLGFVILVVFGLRGKLFPLMGTGTGVVDTLYHLAMPALTLGLIKASFMTRLTRSAMLDVLRRD